MSILPESWDYSQPEFYHFSEDSIFLSKFAASHLEGDRRPFVLCEPFAGCGVISIELLGRNNFCQKVTFLELQNEFIDHLHINIKKFVDANRLQHCRVIEGNYLDWREKVDVIIANPPYFMEEKSRPARDERKRLCRQMAQREFYAFFDFCSDRLNKDGVVFVCMRFKAEEFFSKYFKVMDKQESRGAIFYRLEKTD